MPITETYHRKRYRCKTCLIEFETPRGVRIHITNNHLQLTREQGRVECNLCNANIYNRRLANHLLKEHTQTIWYCIRCARGFNSMAEFDDHFDNDHATPTGSQFQRIRTAFGRNLSTFQHKFELDTNFNLEEAFSRIGGSITRLVKHQLDLKHYIKFSIIFQVRYVKYDEMGAVAEHSDCFLRSTTKTSLLMQKNKTARKVSNQLLDIIMRNEQFINAGSGWTLNQVLQCNVEIGRLHLAGGCNLSKIRLPKFKQKHVIDVPSKNNNCFFNAISIGLLPTSVYDLCPQKLSLLTRQFTKKQLKCKGIRKPVDVRDIPKFERKNRHLQFRVNVFCKVKTHIIPIYRSKYSLENKLINLLL